jgi:iron(III) transport system substrate-binding protein
MNRFPGDRTRQECIWRIPEWIRKICRQRQDLLTTVLGVAVVFLLASGCGLQKPEVVIYTSVDQPFAEPVLAGFERESGIRVRAVYDVEAAKTTGLVNRLIAEKSRPQADVFWNSEVLQTIRLKQAGILQPYRSPAASQIPPAFQDADGWWTGNTARARVLIINTQRVKDPQSIQSLEDLLNPGEYRGETGIANPLFGTTATHAAVLYAVNGSSEGKAFFEQLVQNGTHMVDGNAMVRDMVASGQLAYGLTDTDDACGAYARGDPVALILPDQESQGTLIIPSTAALIAGAPHAAEGRALIDYLLSRQVEQALINTGYSHVALHAGLDQPRSCPLPGKIRALTVDYQEVYRLFETAQEDLRGVLSH